MTRFHRLVRAISRRLPVLALLIMGVPVATSCAPDEATAKTPGRSYCFLGRCHRVLTLGESRLRLGRTEIVRASFYDSCARDRFNPCALTSSGEAFRPSAPDNAASPVYPDGTILLLFYPVTGAAAVVRVNNAGPYHSTRLIDVSVATADALGFRELGLADLEVRVVAVPRADEATYRRLRRYWPVHGPIGRHGSIAEAHEALVRVSEFPRVPARPDAAQLVALPMVDVEAAPVGAGAHVAVADHPVVVLGPTLPHDALTTAPVRLEDRLVPVAPPRASAAATIPPIVVVQALPTPVDVGETLAREMGAREVGLLASLRAKARHRLTPGRLPDLGLGSTAAWLGAAATRLAAHARGAARAGLRTQVPARLASLGGGGQPAETISRR